MKQPILLTIFLIVFIQLATAVTLDSGTTLNTSVSNSSIQFPSITVTADKVVVESTYIDIFNASYTNGNLDVAITGKASWNKNNTNLNSDKFPYLSSDADADKAISSLFINPVNATLTFDVADCEIESITYSSHNSAYTQTYSSGWTCVESTGRLTLDVIGIEYATASNNIHINYIDAELGTDNSIKALGDIGSITGIVIILAVLGFIITALIIAYAYQSGTIQSMEINWNTIAYIIIIAMIALMILGALVVTLGKINWGV